jgi:hypothetical protein
MDAPERTYEMELSGTATNIFQECQARLSRHAGVLAPDTQPLAGFKVGACGSQRSRSVTLPRRTILFLCGAGHLRAHQQFKSASSISHGCAATFGDGVGNCCLPLRLVVNGHAPEIAFKPGIPVARRTVVRCIRGPGHGRRPHSTHL